MSHCLSLPCPHICPRPPQYWRAFSKPRRECRGCSVRVTSLLLRVKSIALGSIWPLASSLVTLLKLSNRLSWHMSSRVISCGDILILASAFLETVARGPVLLSNIRYRESLLMILAGKAWQEQSWLSHFSTQTSSIVSISIWFIWLLNEWSDGTRLEAFFITVILSRLICWSHSEHR